MVVPYDVADSAQDAEVDRVIAWLDSGGDVNDVDQDGFTLINRFARGGTLPPLPRTKFLLYTLKRPSTSLSYRHRVTIYSYTTDILRGRERAATYSLLCSAVITTVFTMSSTVQPRERSFTGLARPCMMGPTAMVFDACWTAL